MRGNRQEIIGFGRGGFQTRPRYNDANAPIRRAAFSLVLVARPIYAQSAPGRLTPPQRKPIEIPATSTLGDTETDTTIAHENRDRRERARFLTRFAVGGGYGFADQLDSGGVLMEAHLGLRQQLTSLFGLHVQLLTVFGPRDYVQRSEDGTVTRSELGASVTPYIGPVVVND